MPTNKNDAKRDSNHPPGSVRRRDGAGHLDPGYAAELRQLTGTGGMDEAPAFIPTNRTDDDLAEQLGELAVEAATSGEDRALDLADENTPEDTVSPFRVARLDTDAEEEEEEE